MKWISRVGFQDLLKIFDKRVHSSRRRGEIKSGKQTKHNTTRRDNQCVEAAQQQTGNQQGC